jgi:REP element-mobilizing transposase RayT
MAHSYAQNHIHLVFSTKERAKLISKQFQPRLWAYIAGICKNHDMLPFAVAACQTIFMCSFACRLRFRSSALYR